MSFKNQSRLLQLSGALSRNMDICKVLMNCLVVKDQEAQRKLLEGEQVWSFWKEREYFLTALGQWWTFLHFWVMEDWQCRGSLSSVAESLWSFTCLVSTNFSIWKKTKAPPLIPCRCVVQNWRCYCECSSDRSWSLVSVRATTYTLLLRGRLNIKTVGSVSIEGPLSGLQMVPFAVSSHGREKEKALLCFFL